MASIKPVNTKKGTVHRVFWYKPNDPKQYSKQWKPDKSRKWVERWAAQQEADEFDTINPATTHSLEDASLLYTNIRKTEIDIWRHKRSLDLFKDYLNPKTKIGRINHHIIHQYRDNLLADRLERWTEPTFQQEQRTRRGINKELSNLRTVFTWFYKNDLIARNPFDKVAFLKASAALPPVLSREEEKKFFDAMPKRGTSRLAWKIMKYTGIRRGECPEIRWRDLDLDRGFLFLAKTKNRQESIVPLHPDLISYLWEWQIEHGMPDPDCRVTPYHPDSLTCIFRRALDRASLQHKKEPVHILRHTLGARIMENDLSDTGERMAQEILRHNDRSMTRKYTQIAKQNIQSKFGKMKI